MNMSMADMVIENTVDRGFYNTSYLLMLLNDRLATWAKEHRLNSSRNNKGYLMFVTQIESTSLTDVYLTLEYHDGEEIHQVPAAYIGQKVSKIERKGIGTIPLYTFKDLSTNPPYGVIMTSRLSKFATGDQLLTNVALSIHNFMLESAGFCKTLKAKLACGNGKVYLFIEDSTNQLTKIEFYIEDMVKFLKTHSDNCKQDVRDSVKNLIKKGQNNE